MRSAPRRNMANRKSRTNLKPSVKTGTDAAALEPSIAPGISPVSTATITDSQDMNQPAPGIILSGTRTANEEVLSGEDAVKETEDMMFLPVRLDPNLKGMLKAEQWEPYIESGWKLEKNHPDSSEDIAILSMSKREYALKHVSMNEYYDRVTDGREVVDDEIAQQTKDSASASRRTTTLRSETMEELLERMPATPDDLIIEKLTNPDFDNPDVGDA